MIIFLIIGLIFGGICLYFGVGMLLDRDISSTKLMILGLNISIVGVLLAVTTFLNAAYFIGILGLLLALISFIIDPKND